MQKAIFTAPKLKGLNKEIKKNDIFLFVSSGLYLGKMQVLSIDENKQLSLKFILYSKDYSVASYRERYRIENNTLLDIDNLSIEYEENKDIDFLWESADKSKIFPKNNIGIYLLKSSRTNEFH